MTRGNNSAAGLVTTDLNPTGYFHEKVVEAQARQKLKLSENVEFYVVNLLSDFVTYQPPENDNEGDCLALLLKRALEGSFGERMLIYKRIADTSLYYSGFFQDYFATKCFDIKYYMTMGENAFDQLAQLTRSKAASKSSLSSVYNDMSKNFLQAVDVIMDVSEHTTLGSGNIRSTLSVYEAWLSTESSLLEKELLNRGIIPITQARKLKN